MRRCGGDALTLRLLLPSFLVVRRSGVSFISIPHLVFLEL